MAETPYLRQPTRPVPLCDVCELLGLPAVAGDVTGVSLSSDAVAPADLYAALPGARTHGARFARQAIAAGAAAVLTDFEGAGIIGDVDVPVLIHPDPRGVLGQVSALIYGHPATRLQTFAVTGTNGKTTVTYMLTQALDALGVPAGLIGTTGTWIGGRRLPTARTTPEAPDVQALMALMIEQDMKALAMEVSSHALVLGRVDAIRFNIAAFTNLSPDHLDFHSSMADYFAAKASLFTDQRCDFAIINIDDEWGRQLVAQTTVQHWTYGLTREADWTVANMRSSASGSQFEVAHAGRSWPVSLAAPGEFNVVNAACAMAMLVAAGFDAAEVAGALSAFSGVPGRMEVVRSDASAAPVVIVDYAHTPDAVERALTAVRPLTEGRLWCVMGCGGDRDAAKRPLMGRIAAERADQLIITDDNPRSEQPEDIRAAVLAGAETVTGARVREIADRAEAIHEAIAAADPVDTVMILGKGHETGQEIAGTIRSFDDRAVAGDALAARR